MLDFVPAGKVDVSLLDFDKASPLHLALEAGDMDIVEVLLEAGADVNQPNPDFRCGGWTCACVRGWGACDLQGLDGGTEPGPCVYLDAQESEVQWRG